MRFPAAATPSPVDSSCTAFTAYVSAVDSSSSGSGPFTCAIVFTLYHTFYYYFNCLCGVCSMIRRYRDSMCLCVCL